MGLIPLPERSSINLDDGALDEGVRSDKLIVGSVVNLEDGWSWFLHIDRGTDDTDKPGLPRDVFASPGEVTRLQSQGTVLEVSTSRPDGVNTFGPQFCVSWLTTELKLSLLAVMSTLCPSGRTFVS
jgi:hypothetical protein